MKPDTIIVDASVLIAAARPREEGHSPARSLLHRCFDDGAQLMEPAIVVPEVLGALSRTGSPPRVARQIVAGYRRRSGFTPLPFDIHQAESAGDIASLQRVKGSDAIYLALARELALPLVTLDREQRERRARRRGGPDARTSPGGVVSHVNRIPYVIVDTTGALPYNLPVKNTASRRNPVKSKESPATKRRYPRFWERAVPIAVAVIGLLILALLVFVVAIALGLAPGAR